MSKSKASQRPLKGSNQFANTNTQMGPKQWYIHGTIATKHTTSVQIVGTKTIIKMNYEEEIDKLNEQICDLSFELKQSKDKELIYKDILFNIETSLSDLIKREQENERFNLGETIDHKQALLNLKSSLDEYKRIYKLRF